MKTVNRNSSKEAFESKYEKVSWFERATTTTLKLSQLKNNPEDPFVTEPLQEKIEFYRGLFLRDRDYEVETVKVKKLLSGGYEIQDGHHRAEGARRAGKTRVRVKLMRWDE